jgi:hypothetical protein
MHEHEIADKPESTVDCVRWVCSRTVLGRAAATGLAARYGLNPSLPLGQ